MVRDTLSTTIWSTLGKAVGFLIPFFIAAWFGVSDETDAFFFSYGIVLFLSSIFCPVVESIVVPYIAEARKNEEDVGRFLGKILGISGIGILIICGLLLIIIRPVLSLITHFDQKSLDTIYKLLIEIAPLLLLLTWTSVLSGAINAYKKFVFPAISPAFRAIVNLIIIFVLKNKIGVHAVALGYVFGELVRMGILLNILSRMRLFSLKISFALDPKIREFFKTSSFQIFGMVAVGLNPIIDKIMVSWLEVGSISLLEYADRLFIIPVTFFSSGFVVVILTYLSDQYYETLNKDILRKELFRIAKIMGLLSFIITIVTMLIHKFITYIAFGRGEFPLEKLGDVRILFLLLLIGLMPYTINLIIVRGLIILKNTKSLFKALVLKNIIKILLNLVLIFLLGLNGIVLSTSITAFLILIYLYYEFRKSSNSSISKKGLSAQK